MKPGWKTSEFWLTLAAQAAGAVTSAGLPTDSKAVQIAAVAMQALTLLGYQHSRATVKRKMSDAFGAKEVPQ